MPLRDGFFSTATQTSCCNRIQRSNRVRLLVVSTHDFPDKFGCKLCVCECQLRSATPRDRPTLLFNATTENATTTEFAYVLRSIIIISPEPTVVTTTYTATSCRRANHESSTRVPCLILYMVLGNKYRRVGVTLGVAFLRMQLVLL